MKQSFTGLCTEFSQRVRYNLALIPFIPNDKILKVMEQDGWKKGTPRFSEEQFTAFIAETHHGIPYIPRTTVYDAHGNDAVFGADQTVRDRYDREKKAAAAKVYGIHLQG